MPIPEDKIAALPLPLLTMFYVLEARALATMELPGLGLQDDLAVEVYQHKLTSTYVPQSDKSFIHLTGLRTLAFDNRVKEMLKASENTMVINLGCGLCTRHIRLQPNFKKQIDWLNFDLRQAIEIRKVVFPSQVTRFDRVYTNLLPLNWLASFLALQNTELLLIMEGVTPYLEQEVLNQFLLDLTEASIQAGKKVSLILDYKHPKLFLEEFDPANAALANVLKAGFTGPEDICGIHPAIKVTQILGDLLYQDPSLAFLEIQFKMKHNMDSPYNIVELSLG